jgi:type II secretory pathway component GspD/PulD (secretin)
MKRFAAAATLLYTVLLLPGVACAQERHRSLSWEKQAVEIDRKLAAIVKDLQELRLELRVQPKTTTFSLMYIDAGKAAKKLTAVLGKDPGIAIFSDKDSNTVIVRAPVDQLREVKEILENLDAKKDGLFVIRLKNVEAAHAAKTVKALLGDDRDVGLVPDVRTNSVIMWGTTANVKLAKELLQRLDVKDK